MSLDTGLKKTNAKKPTQPIWKGPEVDGVTFSLLSRFLCCRERFRLLVVEGLQPADAFNHRIHYGQMWHICEEALAGWQAPPSHASTAIIAEGAIDVALLHYCRELCRQYQTQQQQVEHWYNVCRVQFPLYIDYWSKHSDVASRQPLLQEKVFNVPYQLPSGRTVRLRGKLDSVDLIGKGKSTGVYLQENKTKGDIREAQLKRQLRFDLQTMLYVVALQESIDNATADNHLFPDHGPCKGVRYNVIRRPLSGGKGSIVRHKPTKNCPNGESKEAFYGRLRDIIAAEPESYFMRWKVEVTPQDIKEFRRKCLDPILEQLCDWWRYIKIEYPTFS